ncbi:MAG: hypothetical protein HYV35_04300 [Lentisphaerae bacterium]|nr:hypothetical protein [Lentisphaerota bacterium]
MKAPVHLLLGLLISHVLVYPALGANRNFKAATTGDWSVAGNWVEGSVPDHGDDVYITYTGSLAIISSASSNLSTLTLGGGTVTTRLMFTNWDSILSATNVFIQTNGMIMLPKAFTNTQVSNNVYIVCSNLTIASGGSINVDTQGYAGASQTPGSGPGGGSGYQAGGSYGGRGGAGPSSSAGPTYGSSNAPISPGSAGGAHTSPGYPGGSGGGAVRIQASGTVTINGTITANGGDGVSASAGSGSGGGIYITCNSLVGTGGIVRARGSGAGWGGGGGGRIAVIYDTNVQSQIVVPSILFQTAPLSSAGYYGDIGTLYFPDNRFLTETIQHSGQWLVPNTTNWRLNNFVVSNTWLRIPADGFELTVSNRLQVVGTDTNVHRLELTNGVVTTGENVLLDRNQLALKSLNCNGNLIVTNGGRLYSYSGPTNDPATTNWGALLSVTNDILIKTNSVIYLYSHLTNGGAPFVRMRNLTIDSGGMINADGGGFIGRSQAAGYGPGGGSGYQGGGGYGGIGGQRGTSVGGPAYGNSNAPISPGSAGGGHTSPGYPGGSGGGAVRIQVAETLTLNGTITADGAEAPNSSAGGGSGGGIYIVCRILTGSGGGLVRARGCSGGYANGGGGRVAIWRMYDTSSTNITASAAAGSTALGDSPGNGTVVWGQSPVPGTIFSFR